MINDHQLLIFGYCAINPILCLIVYANVSKDFSLIKKISLILLSMFAVFVTFIAAIYYSKNILNWLAIPYYVIQLGGGLLVFIVGVGHLLFSDQMVELRSFINKMTIFGQNQTNPARMNSSMIFDSYKKNREASLGFSPLAIPIMINPVSVLIMLLEGTTINLSTQPHILLIILAICLVQTLFLYISNWLILNLGQIGLLTINRVIGLGLTIIGFEMLVNGIHSIIPILIGIG